MLLYLSPINITPLDNIRPIKYKMSSNLKFGCTLYNYPPLEDPDDNKKGSEDFDLFCRHRGPPAAAYNMQPNHKFLIYETVF